MKAKLVDEYYLKKAIKTVNQWLQSGDTSLQIAGNGAKNTLEYLGLWEEVEDGKSEEANV